MSSPTGKEVFDELAEVFVDDLLSLADHFVQRFVLRVSRATERILGEVRLLTDVHEENAVLEMVEDQFVFRVAAEFVE